MNALLICPSSRPAMQHLAGQAPLAGAPLLGRSLVEYWLTHLAATGAREICVLADDRPEQIASIVEDGARWGLKVDLIAEGRELTPAEAGIKYSSEIAASAQRVRVSVLDHFPGLTELPLFESYSGLFAAMMKWMPRANTVDRVGVREIQPGIWLATHSHVSPDAQLQPPCWIGQNVYIGAGCVIGPEAIIEDRAFIESGAEISRSVIAPDTFVGKVAEIQQSFAWGSTLLNWKTDSHVEIADVFLLCALRQTAPTREADSLLGRLAEVYFRRKRSVQALESISGEQRGLA